MLPKKRRIIRKDFNYIINKGKRHNSPHLLLYLVKIDSNKNDLDSKFSFSVSKKVCPNASHRNKLRRRGYSIITKYIKDIKSNHFFFFVFKKEAKSISFDILEKEINELISETQTLRII